MAVPIFIPTNTEWGCFFPYNVARNCKLFCWPWQFWLRWDEISVVLNAKNDEHFSRYFLTIFLSSIGTFSLDPFLNCGICSLDSIFWILCIFWIQVLYQVIQHFIPSNSLTFYFVGFFYSVRILGNAGGCWGMLGMESRALPMEEEHCSWGCVLLHSPQVCCEVQMLLTSKFYLSIPFLCKLCF